MSREEKEALLNARMEQIRKKNSELQKRYEEVQKDKQNAEAVSETFQESRRSAPPREPITRPKPVRQHERQQQRSLASYPKRSETQKTTEQPTKINKSRPQRLKEDDGPPPDPSYRFLADKSREREDDDIKEKEEQKQDRNLGSRRHPGNYGGRDFDNVKVSIEKRRSYEKTSPRHPPKNKMEMTLCMTGRERREYENWRSERNRIEEDRLNRQRTSSGEWRREWDREKDQEKDEHNKDTGLQWRSSRGRGDGSRIRGRGSSESESHNLREGRSSEQSNWRSQDKDLRYDRKRIEMTEDDKPSRKVQINGSESLNISFTNDVTSNIEKQRTFSRDSLGSQSEDDWRQGELQQQIGTYFNTNKSYDSPRRSLTLLNKEMKGADTNNADQPSLKVVVNLDSVKRNPEEKVDNDESWEEEEEEAGSWEDCTTSGNESLVVSEHSQEEFLDCHLEGKQTTERDVEQESFISKSDSSKVETSSRFADDENRAINREEATVSESGFDVGDFRASRDSRESTPIVEQSKDHSETFQSPIVINTHASLPMTQVDCLVKDLNVEVAFEKATYAEVDSSSRLAGENHEINREDEPTVPESNFDAVDCTINRDSRESTPIVQQSNDRLETLAAPVEVDKNEYINARQEDDAVKDLPVETDPSEKVSHVEDEHSVPDVLTIASTPEVKTESSASDIETKINDPSVVPRLQDEDTATVAVERSSDLIVDENTETKEGVDHAREPTPTNHE